MSMSELLGKMRRDKIILHAAENIVRAIVQGGWWWRDKEGTPPALHFLSFPPCLAEPSENSSKIIAIAKKVITSAPLPTVLLSWTKDIVIFQLGDKPKIGKRTFIANIRGQVYEVKHLPVITPESPYFYPIPQVAESLGLRWKISTHYFPPIPKHIRDEVRLASTIMGEREIVEMLVEKYGEKLLS